MTPRLHIWARMMKVLSILKSVEVRGSAAPTPCMFGRASTTRERSPLGQLQNLPNARKGHDGGDVKCSHDVPFPFEDSEIRRYGSGEAMARVRCHMGCTNMRRGEGGFF